MTKSRSSRSASKRDDAELIYEIPTFTMSNAEILLFDKEDEGVEVIIANIPTPLHLDTGRNYPEDLDNQEIMRAHATAKWILSETTSMLSDYDWKKSYSKSNNPNYNLQDIYFTCDRETVDEAVMTAKQFILEMERQTYRHGEEFERAPGKRPSAELPNNQSD